MPTASPVPSPYEPDAVERLRQAREVWLAKTNELLDFLEGLPPGFAFGPAEYPIALQIEAALARLERAYAGTARGPADVDDQHHA
jgi:hypothetical protein